LYGSAHKRSSEYTFFKLSIWYNNNSNTSLSQDTFNVQLPYDVNQATEQDAWDGDFCSISLHGLLEHLPFNANNIKESLHYMTKYICNKKIENGKFNEVTDLKGIGEVA